MEKYKLHLGISAVLIFICSYPVAELIYTDSFCRLGFMANLNAVAFSLALIVARVGTKKLTRFIYSLGIGLVVSYPITRIIDNNEEFKLVNVVTIIITSFVIFYDYSKWEKNSI